MAGLLWALTASSVGLSAEQANPGLEPGSLAKRTLILERLQQRLPPITPSDAFNTFLKRTGELPPDFDKLPSQFFLPDPLSWVELGRARHATLENWPERRRQMAEQLERWVLGFAPPPPGNVAAEVLEKTTVDGYEMWNVRLTFGPNHAARLGVKLYLPKNRTPSGIFLCDSERYRSWAKKAMEEGNFGFAVHGAGELLSDAVLGHPDGAGDEFDVLASHFGR